MTLREPEAFQVKVSDAQIDDLRRRLSQTRWPEQLPESGWEYGTEASALRELCEYWRESYDWRGFEARFNAHPHYRTEVEGQVLHFYHVRSPEPDAKPLLLTHGWPGSVVEFHEVIGPLTDPARYGGDPRDAFHVVVPALPGFGYSAPLSRRGYRARDIAQAFNTLMQGLGYPRYFAQGGDWGYIVTVMLGALYPDQVTAIHLNALGAPPPNPANLEEGLGERELADVRHNLVFLAQEMAYQQIQATKPQTLAYGLSDSPAGLAGWLLEKFRSWSDCGGQLERIFTRERLLDNISVYWLTGTIGSSMRLYFEQFGPGRQEPLPKVAVPTGHARFPREIVRIPRHWAEARYNITHWQLMERGGHFAAMEVPDLFVPEVQGFFRRYRET